MEVPIDGTVAGDAFRSAETCVVDDASSDPGIYLPADRAAATRVRSSTRRSAPCDETLGVLSVDNAKGGRAFEHLDIEVVTSFSRQAALAIDLARSRGHQGHGCGCSRTVSASVAICTTP